MDFGDPSGVAAVTLFVSRGAGHTWRGSRLPLFPPFPGFLLSPLSPLFLRLALGRTSKEIDATTEIWPQPARLRNRSRASRARRADCWAPRCLRMARTPKVGTGVAHDRTTEVAGTRGKATSNEQGPPAELTGPVMIVGLLRPEGLLPMGGDVDWQQRLAHPEPADDGGEAPLRWFRCPGSEVLTAGPSARPSVSRGRPVARRSMSETGARRWWWRCRPGHGRRWRGLRGRRRCWRLVGCDRGRRGSGYG
jgi:hypothetical protein